jgi:hypothetical protein
MSFTATQTLDDASGDDVVYALVGQDLTSSKRVDTGATVAEPGILSIKHSVSGVGSESVDRHLVQFARTKLTTSGTPRTAVVNLTIAIPRDSVITATIVDDLVANLVDFIADGGFSGSGMAGVTNLTALKRGET